ncbi:MAG: hypothetical protein EAZ66_05110 [Alphaproteobacteria bacterium]|nr:MAG: hypothetical protein EAZ66_05110 [Alphaproteobacteria bacterium]
MEVLDKALDLSVKEIKNNLTWKNFWVAVGVIALPVVAMIVIGMCTGLFLDAGLLSSAAASPSGGVLGTLAGWGVNGFFGAITVGTCFYQANAYAQDNQIKEERLHDQVKEEAQQTALEANVLKVSQNLNQLAQEVGTIKSVHMSEDPTMSARTKEASPSAVINAAERHGAVAQELALGKAY